MTTYYVTYAGLLLAVALGQQGRDVRQVLYWILLIALFLFAGARWEVGCDWSGYLYHYQFWQPGSLDQAIRLSEPGYWITLDLIKLWNLPYPYLNLATSAIFFLGLHLMARRQPNPLAFLALAFPILIINMPMSGIRQAAAIGFVMMAYLAFIDRKLVLFLALVTGGVAFHSSALAFLLLAPFVNGRFSRRNVIVGGLLALPGAYFLLQSDAAELAQTRYIDTGVEAAGSAFRVGLLSLTGLLYFLYVEARWRKAYPADHKLVSLGALMMLGLFLTVPVSSVIGDRFAYYLIPIQLMIFARLPYLFRGAKRDVFGIAPYVALTLLFIVWTQYSALFRGCYIPYQSALF